MCVLGSRGLVAFDLDGPGGKYCSWEKRYHHSNFTLLKVDFWHGTFAHQCWDPVCKSKYQRRWNSHDYQLPDALQRHSHLFQEPEQFDPCLEEFLVSSNGRDMADEIAEDPVAVSRSTTAAVSAALQAVSVLPAAPSSPELPAGALPHCEVQENVPVHDDILPSWVIHVNTSDTPTHSHMSSPWQSEQS